MAWNPSTGVCPANLSVVKICCDLWKGFAVHAFRRMIGCIGFTVRHLMKHNRHKLLRVVRNSQHLNNARLVTFLQSLQIHNFGLLGRLCVWGKHCFRVLAEQRFYMVLRLTEFKLIHYGYCWNAVLFSFISMSNMYFVMTLSRASLTRWFKERRVQFTRYKPKHATLVISLHKHPMCVSHVRGLFGVSRSFRRWTASGTPCRRRRLSSSAWPKSSLQENSYGRCGLTLIQTTRDATCAFITFIIINKTVGTSLSRRVDIWKTPCVYLGPRSVHSFNDNIWVWI